MSILRLRFVLDARWAQFGRYRVGLVSMADLVRDHLDERRQHVAV